MSYRYKRPTIKNSVDSPTRITKHRAWKISYFIPNFLDNQDLDTYTVFVDGIEGRSIPDAAKALKWFHAVIHYAKDATKINVEEGIVEVGRFFLSTELNGKSREWQVVSPWKPYDNL